MILYQFLVGCVPFSGSTPEELFEQVLAAEESVEWPSPEEEGAPPPDAVDLVTRLLARDPNKRLCTLAGALEVKEHVFFVARGFDALKWNSLIRQKAEFVPVLDGDEDTSYFDCMHARSPHIHIFVLTREQLWLPFISNVSIKNLHLFNPFELEL